MTRLVGIVNVTPDSFSGDGCMDVGGALERIDAMIRDGAYAIDIGAESTRPGATPITPAQEWQRLAPLVEALGDRTQRTVFSIDTRNGETARLALAAGFRWVNDVSGSTDEALLEAAKDAGATLVLMHSLGVPADPNHTLAPEEDPVAAVFIWGDQALVRCDRLGLAREKIILDPGIGFGKTAAQSLALIRGAARLKSLGVSLLYGHSRKSFLSQFTDRPGKDRDPETLALSQELAAQGVDYLRVHNIRDHAAMLRRREAS